MTHLAIFQGGPLHGTRQPATKPFPSLIDEAAPKRCGQQRWYRYRIKVIDASRLDEQTVTYLYEGLVND